MTSPAPTGSLGLAAPFAPHGLAGRIRVPPSKSLTQRAFVAAALAGEGSRVVSPLAAEDPLLLFRALQAVGFRLSWPGEDVVAAGLEPTGAAALHLGNNGTGVRFLLAQLAATPGEWLLDGSARLRERPIAALGEALMRLGARIEPAAGSELRLPLRVVGTELTGGEVTLDPTASSQFVSALLLLGPRLPAGLAVRLTATPPSRPYLDLTLEVLEAFGPRVEADRDRLRFAVAPGGLRPTSFAVEGDWSAAAFPLAAVALAGGEVELVNVRRDSRQGDAVVLELLAEAGCAIDAGPGGLAVRGPARRSLHADVRDTPDLFPALAVVVAALGGELRGLAGLTAKESNRLAVMAETLAAIGFTVSCDERSFRAPGSRPAIAATTAPLPCAGDHRIAMALAVAGSVVAGVHVGDAACVAKSWPEFWRSWQALFRERP